MSFNDIKGHDSIVRFFKRELELDRVASAYLFLGPDGVGKAFLAEVLAKALNCLNGRGDACGACASCAKIDKKSHPDVITIEEKDDKDSISIKAVRWLQEKISLKPYEGRSKVFIIKDADAMTKDAQNCLLKTLEEPPAASVIILVTSRPEQLLPTIKSRCKQVKFTPLELGQRAELAGRRGFWGADAVFLARLGSSGIFFPCGPEDKKGIDSVIEHKNSILDEFNASTTLLDEKGVIFKGKKDAMKFAASVFESWFRDIIVLKSAGDASLVINSDRMAELTRLKDKLSFAWLERAIEEIETAQLYIEMNVSPKMAFNDLHMKISLDNGRAACPII